MLDRRNFIKLTSLAAVGGLALGGDEAFGNGAKGYFPVPAEALAQNAFRFNQDTFTRLVNTTFLIRSRTVSLTSMRLVEVVGTPAMKSHSNGKAVDGFSLIFDVGLKGGVRDMIYEVSHPQLGTFPMFISTVGRSGRRFQAVFCRV